MPIDTANFMISAIVLFAFVAIGSYFIGNHIKQSKANILAVLKKYPEKSQLQISRELGVSRHKVYSAAKKVGIKSKFKFGGDRIARTRRKK